MVHETIAAGIDKAVIPNPGEICISLPLTSHNSSDMFGHSFAFYKLSDKMIDVLFFKGGRHENLAKEWD